MQVPREGSDGTAVCAVQVAPPVAPPVHVGVPFAAVEQKNEHLPAPLMITQVPPRAQSLAPVHGSPGFRVPAAAQVGPDGVR